MTDPERYPIGRYERPKLPLDAASRAAMIDAIERMPGVVRSLVEPLGDAELELRYRDGGWTIRQVVHHVADSHMHAYIRAKLAFADNAPTITPYTESRWAELADVTAVPVAASLDLLSGLHRRWAAFLRSLDDPDFQKSFLHPERGPMTIDSIVSLYAWHGRHHTAHIRHALGRAKARA
jgi:hypothetical protein